jgi:hypothetical protein
MGDSQGNDGKSRGDSSDAPSSVTGPLEEEVWSWPSYLAGLDSASDSPECVWSRREEIRTSHALLRRFSPWELQVLLSLKRPPAPKGWTLREDLIILTTPFTAKELAEALHDRNIAAVKKRLQLLKSKGVAERRLQVAPG